MAEASNQAAEVVNRNRTNAWNRTNVRLWNSLDFDFAFIQKKCIVARSWN